MVFYSGNNNNNNYYYYYYYYYYDYYNYNNNNVTLCKAEFDASRKVSILSSSPVNRYFSCHVIKWKLKNISVIYP